MPLNAYLKLKGQIQGDIHGSVTQKGKEKTIKVIEAHHEVSKTILRSLISVTAGMKEHRPFTIVKEVDKSTPLLYKAFVTGEIITQWECKFFQKQGTIEKNYYTVKLTNANILGIKFVMPNTINPNTKIFPEYEEVSFIYDRIDWTIVDGGITSSDNYI